MTDVRVQVYWDVNTAPLPRQFEELGALEENIQLALRRFNSRYTVDGITACGYKELFIQKSRLAVNIYAPERYCLCFTCTEKIKRGRKLPNVDTERWKLKEETPDSMITRLMYKMAREKLPSTPTVFLLVSWDDAFRATMMDLKGKKGKTVLLARPDDAEVGFGEGFEAVWSVESLISGGDHI